jgi:hypothetical protein
MLSSSLVARIEPAFGVVVRRLGADDLDAHRMTVLGRSPAACAAPRAGVRRGLTPVGVSFGGPPGMTSAAIPNDAATRSIAGREYGVAGGSTDGVWVLQYRQGAFGFWPDSIFG